MKRKILVMVGILVLLVAVPGARAQVKPAETRPVTVTPNELEALRADARKMRVMINQMRVNLGSVASTTTPLGHQFELEMDMWQMVLDQMDRRIGAMEGSTKTEK